MAALFSSLGVAASGMGVYKTWIDATADNVANVNTVRRTSESAYRAKYVVAAAVPGGTNGVGRGSAVASIGQGDRDGTVVYDPNHPLADEQGMVRYPSVNLVDQMTHLIIAQRAYQANVTVFERARDSYLRALEIGK